MFETEITMNLKFFIGWIAIAVIVGLATGYLLSLIRDDEEEPPRVR